jgi:uncharacterized membrane protein YdjX (TVP38/TMEM64 family)
VWLRGLAVVGSLLVLGPLVWTYVPILDTALAAIALARDAGPMGGVLFGLMFVAGAPLTLLAEVFMAASGLLFGALWGGVWAWACALLGATINLVLARTLLRERLARRWRGQGGPLADLEDRLAERGLWVVILLRLPPLSPFHVISYALALTRVRVRDYLIGTAVGAVPQIVLFAWIGSTLGDVEALQHPTEAVSAGTWALVVGVTVFATLAVTFLARRELRRLSEGEPAVRR